MNHLLHNASTIQQSLDKQSELLLSSTPPEALTVFNEVSIGVSGLRSCISQFAKKFGLQQENLIPIPPGDSTPITTSVNVSCLGNLRTPEEVGSIISTLATEHNAFHCKIFDMRWLITSMCWNPAIVTGLEPTQTLSRVLMFRYEAISELKDQYLNHDNNKMPSSPSGHLAVYLHDLSNKGWAISLRKNVKPQGKSSNYFFIVTQEMDNYLSTWTPNAIDHKQMHDQIKPPVVIADGNRDDTIQTGECYIIENLKTTLPLTLTLFISSPSLR